MAAPRAPWSRGQRVTARAVVILALAALAVAVTGAPSNSLRVSTGQSTPVTQYVLANPKAPCRTQYVKRTLTLYRRKLVSVNGSVVSTTVKVRVVGCVLVTSPLRSSPPLFGLTFDNVANLNEKVAVLRALPVHPTARVIFDVGEPARHYAVAVSELHAVAGVMGLLLDSSAAASISAAEYQTRVENYLRTLAPHVDVWEIGNEVNGSWAGPYANAEARITEAFGDVAAIGANSALTLYANEYAPNNCGDGTSELTPVQFTKTYVSATVRDGLAYVFESYYPTQCHDTYPTNAQVRAEMRQLHALYPHALVGFGEVGLPRRATTRTLPTAARVMSWAYHLNPRLSYYVGGYFWWYGAEDLVPASKPLHSTFVAALVAEDSLLN